MDEIRNMETLESDRLRVLAKHRIDALRRAEEEEIRLEELKLVSILNIPFILIN